MEFNEVKDSGERQDFGTGSVRDTQAGKGRYDLLPPRAVRRLAQHFENGAVKYGDRNWEKGQPLGRYLDSALRHTFAILQGKRDEDHAAAAAWNLMAFIETAERIEAGEMWLDRDVANALDDIGYVQDSEPEDGRGMTATELILTGGPYPIWPGSISKPARGLYDWDCDYVGDDEDGECVGTNEQIVRWDGNDLHVLTGPQAGEVF